MLASNEAAVTPKLREYAALAAVGPHSYLVSINIRSGGFALIHIEFFDSGRNNVLATFNGMGGGLAAGQNVTGGTAWLNYDLDTILNQMNQSRFEANYWWVASNVNLWDMNGVFLGSMAGGGLGMLGGIIGGQGSFYRGRVKQ